MASSRSFNTLYDIANAVIANWDSRPSTIKGTKENWLRTCTFLHDLLRMDIDLVDWISSTCALTVATWHKALFSSGYSQQKIAISDVHCLDAHRLEALLL